MDDSPVGTFLKTAALTVFVALALGAMVTPPDPFTLLYTLAILVPVAFLVAYVLTYGGGFALLRERV